MGTDQRNTIGWSADLQRVALWVVIASVSAAALMGVFALLVGTFGDTQGRILGTTAFILLASLLVMATTPAVTRRWLTPLPEAGIGLAVAGFGLLSIVIWNDDPADNFVKTAVIPIIWSVAIAHASLLSAARLKEAFAWSLWVAYGSASVLAGTFTVLILNDFGGGDAMGRFVGVVAIVAASSSIAVPVFHRMSQLSEVAIDFGDLEPGQLTFGYCPACGAHGGPHQPGELMACPKCRVRTIVQLAEDDSQPNPVEAQTHDGEPV